MKTYALLFSIDTYPQLDELKKMSSEKLFDLAWTASTFDDGDASVLTLEEFSNMVNDDRISTEFSWLFFVNREEG